MFSAFFIDRPIFATVLSAMITLVGGIALWSLPIAQYPRITPPAIQVSISYPGANAQTVADTVAAPIEQQVTGVPGMLYMSSQSGNDGAYSLTVTFDVNTDLNTALVMVQNRVALAMPLLPTPVQKQGITIRKRTPDILMIVSLVSPQRQYNDLYLSNYALIHIRDELLRVEGVGDVFIAGERDYSLRVWLDPVKLSALNLSATDVANAIRRQNIEAVAGQVGQPPAIHGQSMELPIDALGRLSEPEQFGEIIVKVSQSLQAQTSRAVSTPIRTMFDLPGAGNFDPLLVTQALDDNSDMTTTSAGADANDTTTNSTNVSGGATATGGATAPGGATNLDSNSTSAGSLPSQMTSSVTSSDAGAVSASDSLGDLSLAGLSINTAVTAGATDEGVAITGNTSRRPPPLATGIVRLRDVARVEMGAQNYNLSYDFDGEPSVGLIVYQLPGTNAIDVATRVNAKMRELKERFPVGVDYNTAYDTTVFISESVADVVNTLLLAVALVGIVVLVFLQSWRAVLIPMAAVPVAIIGTFSVMAVAGFSLNNISLFGLVLAIGIVVDDAIVVVENVERWLERGASPRDAALGAMREVTSPVVAMALVLCTVFIPCAFISGITGRFFREFAITIAVSTLFSALNSLTLSPALAAIVLRPRDEPRDWLSSGMDGALGWFFRLFNRAFGTVTTGYDWTVDRLLRRSGLMLAIYAGLLVATVFFFRSTPTGFVPQQDQGRIIVSVQLPDSASLERTKEVLHAVEAISRKAAGVDHTISIAGMSFVQQATGSNFGSIFVTLAPFEKRRSSTLRDEAIMAKLRQQWAREIKDAVVLAFSAPPIPGLSVAGGFKIMVEDKAGLGLPTLQEQTDRLVERLQKEPGLTGVSTQFRSRTPQLFMDIDRTKIQTLDVSFEEAFQSLQIYLGSLYVNSFNQFGRHWQVTLQADGKYRARTESLPLFQVRNQTGQMVSLGTLVNVRESSGPVFVTRYNLSTAAPITGGVLPSVSSGQVIASTEREAKASLPRSMNTEWTELIYLQIREGDTTLAVFSLAVLCVFLMLAALYESWSLPLAVILVVPLYVLCSLVGVWITGGAVNIFVQIGLVVLVGLACKNAILIVEFARHLHEQGKPVLEATREASRLRLRPILMTSFAFILGVLPLVIATGAGAEMRRSLGTAVFSGMLGVTLFGVFFTPVFFAVIRGLGDTPWFAGATMQQVLSYLAGAASGMLGGWLLARLGIVDSAWGVILGGCTGVLAVAVSRGVRRRASS